MQAARSSSPTALARAPWLLPAALALCLAAPAAAQSVLALPAGITQLITQATLVTTTKHHRPGDPLNVALVGSREEITAAMQAAGWQVPVPVSLRSGAKIVASVAIRHTYFTAPVSALYYLGRKQDLAFEKEVGHSASRRHHVRFWKLRDDGPDGRALWLGAATFDRGVGLSHRTGVVTHHIDGNVDAERAFLMDELNRALRLTALQLLPGHGPIRARNGGGDAYWSDGNVELAIIAPGAAAQAQPAAAPAAPAAQP